MNPEYVAKLAPIGDPVTPASCRGETFSPWAFDRRLNPGNVPVLASHERDLVIGRVGTIFPFDDGPRGRWLMATFTLTDDEAGRIAADMTRVGSAVSVAYVPYLTEPHKSGVLIRSAVLTEVSLVPEGAIRGAKIVRVRELPESPRVASPPRPWRLAPGEVVVDAPPGALLIRPNTGVVLGVR